MGKTYDNPQSRVEAILQNMLGANNELQPPQTRVEELLLDILENGGGGGDKAVKWVGVTTTPLEDGATTNPITVEGKSVTVVRGDMASYDHDEFIYDGEEWQALGDVSGLGALAFKDSASTTVDDYVTSASSSFEGESLTSSGKFTPQGNVSNVELNTTTVNSITDVGTLPSYTPPTYTPSSYTEPVYVAPSYTPASFTAPTCAFPTYTLVDGVLTVAAGSFTAGSFTDGTFNAGSYTAGEFTQGSMTGGSFDAGTLPTKGADQTVATTVKTQPAFTGTEGDVSVSGTPSGSVTTDLTKTNKTITVS